MTTVAKADDVLDFWFQELTPKQHFMKDEALDEIIRERFLALHEALSSDIGDFGDSARGKLAAIIVFDQFSRNIFRGDGRSFATDPIALDLAKQLVAAGDDMRFSIDERVFLYMPYMHAENVHDQDTSVRLYKSLGIANNYEYAQKHRDVVRKFGRFPHRNAALGRPSSPEEELFINTPGTSF